MKHSFFVYTILLALISSIMAISAHADNIMIEDALRKRADLSSFYQALVETGVNHELNANTTYTVFAPTNEALARISRNQYPCIQAMSCKAEIAAIVRNHIVQGAVNLDDESSQRGRLVSISGRYVAIGELSRNGYAVDGNNIIYATSLGNSMLYKIDGVIANPVELASLQYPVYAPVQEKKIIRTTQKTIPDPACGPHGCPDATTQTTTTIVNTPDLSPGR